MTLLTAIQCGRFDLLSGMNHLPSRMSFHFALCASPIRALLASKHDTADARVDIAHPTAANCGRVVGDVIALEKVDITTARAVKVAGVRVHGKVATLKLVHVPGLDGGTTSLSAVVTDVNGTWTITSFS